MKEEYIGGFRFIEPRPDNFWDDLEETGYFADDDS